MAATILGWLGSLLGGPFAKAAVDAYRAKLTAENTAEKIAADLAAKELALNRRERELAAQIVIAEQGRWLTALPRPLFALAVRFCPLAQWVRPGVSEGSTFRSAAFLKHLGQHLAFSSVRQNDCLNNNTALHQVGPSIETSVR